MHANQSTHFGKKGGKMGPQGEKIKQGQNKAKHTELFFLRVFSLRANCF